MGNDATGAVVKTSGALTWALGQQDMGQGYIGGTIHLSTGGQCAQGELNTNRVILGACTSPLGLFTIQTGDGLIGGMSARPGTALFRGQTITLQPVGTASLPCGGRFVIQ